MSADSRVVAHQWFRNGEATFTGWINGLPSERALQAQRHCHEIQGVTWTVEYAVPLTLLAEAESRIVNLENSIAAMRRTRDEMQGNLITLQSRLDAAGDGAALQQAIEEAIAGKFVHVTSGGTLRLILKRAEEIRSAALGGESHGNEEVG